MIFQKNIWYNMKNNSTINEKKYLHVQDKKNKFSTIKIYVNVN